MKQFVQPPVRILRPGHGVMQKIAHPQVMLRFVVSTGYSQGEDMLLELHVRNLALIEKADLELKEGLTILTGETGAGKSVLIDSINMALGAKAGASSIRQGADCAYIELLFGVSDDARIAKIRELEIPIEQDGTLIISRRILPSRSVFKVNDQTVTAGKLKAVTGILIDMHGQFEHQSLMYPESHLRFIDKLTGTAAADIKTELSGYFREYTKIKSELSERMDAALRAREADILEYEIKEIDEAALKDGEEEELLSAFRRMRDSSKINEHLSEAARELDIDNISHAVRELSQIAHYDGQLESLKEQASQIDDMLGDIRNQIDEFAGELEFDEEEFRRVEERLDVIHRLQGKYGDDIEGIRAAALEKQQRLDFLENYDASRRKLEDRRDELEQLMDGLCERLTDMRQRTGDTLAERIRSELRELNFLTVEFDIAFERLDAYTADGRDRVEFMISTNPGQPLRPIREVASGGELSRIMLAMKSVLADTDEIETLVFDEIDTGISGITAGKVAQKLKLIGRNHQVLCITHQPQIAAMADNHYMISKSTDGSSTRTDIRLLDRDDMIDEIARLMGSSSETVKAAAREMKSAADSGRI